MKEELEAIGIYKKLSFSFKLINCPWSCNSNSVLISMSQTFFSNPALAQYSFVDRTVITTNIIDNLRGKVFFLYFSYIPSFIMRLSV